MDRLDAGECCEYAKKISLVLRSYRRRMPILFSQIWISGQLFLRMLYACPHIVFSTLLLRPSVLSRQSADLMIGLYFRIAFEQQASSFNTRRKSVSVRSIVKQVTEFAFPCYLR